MNQDTIYILRTLMGSSFFRPNEDGTLRECSSAMCPCSAATVFVSDKRMVKAMRELESNGLVHVTTSECGRKYIVKTAYNAYQEAAQKGAK